MEITHFSQMKQGPSLTSLACYSGLQIRVCIEIFFFITHPSKTYFVCTKKNRLNEMVLLSTQNTKVIYKLKG